MKTEKITPVRLYQIVGFSGKKNKVEYCSKMKTVQFFGFIELIFFMKTSTIPVLLTLIDTFACYLSLHLCTILPREE